ncbi:VIT1/CCC1 transporter family protein [Undibacterium sp. TJN25]|uniref:VIT1/CCC1 transporter family protein n=1 Tax=Undibacterium sp. TJN25 TaxID=3413056 RepID=UPI003BF13C6A
MEKAQAQHSKLENIGWLRAAVLGANDGIVSTASLVLGVAASQASHSSILVAGAAGLVAGAMSMATGEYVSVQSQLDAEQAALAQERAALSSHPKSELYQLADIYIGRGLDPALAEKVAAKLIEHDALGALARDELGITEALSARPLQAAMASALSFSIGAALPLLAIALAPPTNPSPAVVVASLLFLAVLGGLAARAGGADVQKGVLRVTFWSALSMGVAIGAGALFGATL